MRLTDFAGVQLPGNNEENDTPIELRNNLIELRDGSYDQDGSDTAGRPVQVGRQITVMLSCEDDELDDLIHALTQGRRILRGVLNDNVTYRQTFAKVASISRPYSIGTHDLQQLQVTFQMDYPYWLASDDEPKYFDNSLLLTGFPFDGQHDDATINAVSTTFTINNDGQERVPRGKVIIIPAVGASITNPKIANAANLMWLKYTGVVANPHRLEIDFLTKTIKYDAVAVYNAASVPLGQMDWMILERDDNVITVTCDAVAGNTTLEWHWARHYR